MESSTQQVRTYYDHFLHQRMLSYRVEGNLRIKLAAHFFTTWLREDNIIVDLGCGIGITAEAMATRARKGFVVGLDLSEQNIWYAKKTITLPNVSFHSLDIVNNADEIISFLPKKPHVITLCDVIEHIPENSRVTLLRQLAKIGAEDLRILLTFPSKYYQDFLRRENPSELQIIDNSISSECLVQEAAQAGLCMTFLRVMDVWRKAQYVHCVLERDETINKRASESVEGGIRISVPLLNRLFRRYRRWKYIDKVFAEGGPSAPRSARYSNSSRD